MSGPDIVLIDTGMRGSSKIIGSYLKGLAKNLTDIKYIFITHPDLDHIGGAAEMKKLTGAKLIIHIGDVPALTGDSSSRLRNKGRFVKILMWILSKLMHASQVDPDIILKEANYRQRVEHKLNHNAGKLWHWGTEQVSQPHS